MKQMRLPMIVVFLALACPALAADLPCGPAEAGVITVDGLTDDWHEVEGVNGGGDDRNLSFSLKCNIGPSELYLLIDVKDSYFVRTRQNRGGEDHLTLQLDTQKLAIYPGNASDIADHVTGGLRKMSIRSTLQAMGWAVELALPLSQLSGFRRGVEHIPFKIEVADCDSKAALKTERSLAMSGNLQFTEGSGSLQTFLDDRGLSTSDVLFSHPIHFDGKSGATAVLAGKYLAAVGDGYVYVELPIKSHKDIKDIRVIDLAGNGTQHVVLRYLEQGDGGARELLAVYRLSGSEPRRLFAAEIGKWAGPNAIEDKVNFVPRGKATDIDITANRAQGFSAANYQEAPAEDAVPILLPWAADKHARYQFRGDDYFRK